MGGRVRGLWPFAAVGVIAAATVAGLVAVWQSPHRGDLEGFAGLAITVAGIAVGWIAWLWRARSQQASGFVSGQELGRLADLLAGAVDAEWTRAAGERGLLEPEPIPVQWQKPATPFAGPVAAAVASTRFAPLPGLAAAGEEQQLQAGQVSELHEVYGGQGSGRLVIAGGPGSGKSGAAVLLILAALRYRRSVAEKVRPEVPVPVMFTLHGWDPGTQRAPDWLAERLGQTYPLFAGRQGAGAARRMLDEGQIAVILDGLDEIPEKLRPAVLRALGQGSDLYVLVLRVVPGHHPRPLLVDGVAYVRHQNTTHPADWQRLRDLFAESAAARQDDLWDLHAPDLRAALTAPQMTRWTSSRGQA